MATAQNESLLKNTRSMLRSVLLSAPRGVRARNLEGEYRGITGKVIPYRQLGYKSLKDFMNSLQDVARLSMVDGEPVYYGVADSSTAHIAKMVAKQKKPKKKSQPLFSAAKRNRGSGQYKGRQQYSYTPHHRTTDYSRPTTDYSRPTTDYSRPTTDYSRPTSDYSRPTTDYSRARPVSYNEMMPQPERVVHIVESASKTVGKTGGAFATKSWKESAMKVDIMGYVTNMELKSVQLVQLTGYIQSPPEEHSFKGIKLLRVLVCSSPELIIGKGQSVMCHFFFSDWNYQQDQGPWSLKRGHKVTFYGQPWARSSAKVKESMALKVLYYDVINDRSLIGDTVTSFNVSAKKTTSDVSMKKTDSQSPKKATIARPASDDNELENRLYEIVKENTAGIYYDRVKVLYQKQYGHEINDDKIANMKSIRIEQFIANIKIIYPVKQPSKEATSNTSTLIDELPPANLPKAGEHMKVLVTHVTEGPQLFYAQICCNETIKNLQYLETMTSAINKSSEELTDSSVGQYCAALYNDNSWNRAVITETKLIFDRKILMDDISTMYFSCGARRYWKVKGSAKGSKLRSHVVQYIDYGNTTSVPSTELRKLPADYWKIPIQAIPCALSLDVDDECLDNKATLKRFNELILDKTFLVKVKSINDEEILIVDMFREEDDMSVASLLQDMLSLEKPSLPDCIQPSFGDDGEICCMDVFVSLVESPASFYVQFIGEDYSDKFSALESDLEKYVTNKQLITLKSFEVNDLILHVDDDQSCQRALVLSDEDNDHVRIQLVDYGHIMTVNKDKLFILPNKFWKLPFQGRQCFLYECADFVDTQPVTEEFTALAEDKQLVALIVDSSSSRLAVQLTTGDDIIVNDLLRNKHCPLSDLHPQLPEAGKVTRGVLTNVSSEGLLTLQLAGVGSAKLKEIEQKINSLCNTGSIGIKHIKKICLGQQCLAKCDDKYYRAKVTKILSVTEVEVNLVDYGQLVTVDKLKIRTIDDGSVWSLPYQAITCSLDNLPPSKETFDEPSNVVGKPSKGSWTEEATDYLKQKCSDEVTIEGTERLGSVRLYLQNSDDEEDLNETLQSSPHLFGLPCENKIVNAEISDKQGDDGCHGDDTSSDQFNTNRNSNVLCYQPLSQCDDKGDKTIKSGEVLQPDTFQVVKVTHVQHASNEFTVQLLSNQKLIEKLTEELQVYCDTTPSSYATIGDLIGCNYCAAKHNGLWCRAQLLDIKGQDILVTLLDYGPNVVTCITFIHQLHDSMVAIPTQAIPCLHYLSLKEGMVRPSEITPGNLYHCFPYFRSKQCYVVSLVDYKTNTILQSST